MRRLAKSEIRIDVRTHCSANQTVNPVDNTLNRRAIGHQDKL